jgi:hypothetical protein
LIGHCPGFWAEISAEVSLRDKFGYPPGPVRKEGSLVRLLRSYPNLYADISARSGLNAISRDREFGARFLNEFHDRILFGTDVCFAGPEERIPTLQHLKGLLGAGKINPEVFDAITGTNALKILPFYRA